MKNKKLIGLFIVLIIGIGVFFFIIFNKKESYNITKVTKVLSDDYYEISCIDTNCEYLVAKSGEKLKESKVEIIDSKGKVVANYNEIYDKDKTRLEPIMASNNNIVFKDNNNEENVLYVVTDNKGKEVYKTDKNIFILTNKHLIVKEDNNYKVINEKGNIVYNSASDYLTYNNKKIIEIVTEDGSVLFNRDGKELLSGYSVSEEVKNDSDETVYLIVKEKKNSNYFYFDINKNKIKGDSFELYQLTKGTTSAVITRSTNNKKEKYTLSEDGTQKKNDDSFIKSIEVSKIKGKLNQDKYYLYTASVYKNNQNKVLVDNKETKEFGLLNIKKDKFEKIYSYKDTKNYYSSINKLNEDEDNTYLQISCNSNNCEGEKVLIYDMKNLKTLFEQPSSELIMQKYFEYEDDYKVVKYANTINDDAYRGYYVVYDSSNKELIKSKTEIVIIDKKQLFGPELGSNLMLYSTVFNKYINDENTSVTPFKLKNKKLYRTNDSSGKAVVYDENGKEIVSTNYTNYLRYSSDLIVYLSKGTVKIYNVLNNKNYEYKLEENEKITDYNSNIISPYKGGIYVSNSKDKYIKILNDKGKVIKTINNEYLYGVKEAENGVFIMTRDKTKINAKFGLYIAK